MTPAFRRATGADRTALEALQEAAYAGNRALLGVEPLPLLADYGAILATMEVWLAESATDGGLAGALILEVRAEDLLIWSLATDPGARGSGLGRSLLGFAETRAHAHGRRLVRLYTGEKLTANIAWYGRHGYALERIEELADRRAVHMVKRLDSPFPPAVNTLEGGNMVAAPGGKA
jgi:ribosomal protein S18 acetylase RimI-like enzyme